MATNLLFNGKYNFGALLGFRSESKGPLTGGSAVPTYLSRRLASSFYTK